MGLGVSKPFSSKLLLEPGSLDLSHKGLVSVPAEIQERFFTDFVSAGLNGNAELILKKIDMSHNSLRWLPASLTNCSMTLTVLKLKGNSLEQFPSQLLHLKQLELLDLSCNAIPSLPEQLDRLTRLDMLDVSGNKLRRLPACLCPRRMPQLLMLKLDDNYLDIVALSCRVGSERAWTAGVEQPHHAHSGKAAAAAAVTAAWGGDSGGDVDTGAALYRAGVLHGLNRQYVPTRICPRLYLGCYQSAWLAGELSALGIQHVVTIGGHMPPKVPLAEFRVLILDGVADVEEQDLAKALRRGVRFINQALGRRGAAVAWQCALAGGAGGDTGRGQGVVKETRGARAGSGSAEPRERKYDAGQGPGGLRIGEEVASLQRDVGDAVAPGGIGAEEEATKGVGEGLKKVEGSEGVEETKGSVLVHCREGISRSASLVLAFLLQRVPLKTCLRFVRSRRWVVEPNKGFMVQLQQLDVYHRSQPKGHFDPELWKSAAAE